MNILRKIEISNKRLKFKRKFSSKKPIVILNYHQISETFDSTTQDIKIWTSLKDFEQTLITLKQEGFEFISLEKAVELYESKSKPNGNYVSVTFDDGHKSVLNMKRVIEEHQVPVMLFINSDYINDRDFNWVDILQYFDRHPKDYYDKYNISEEDWTNIRALRNCSDNDEFIDLEKKIINLLTKIDDFKIRYLTEKELFEWQSPLITIGLHGARHYKFDVMSDETLSQNIKKDIEYLASHTNYKPFFAFPFGKYKQSSLDLVKKNKVVPFFHRGGVNYFDENTFGLKRIPVGNHQVNLNTIADYSNELTLINHIFKFFKKLVEKK